MANVTEKTKLEQIAKLVGPDGRQAWGGIGGSGKHAAELRAELEALIVNPEAEKLLAGGRQAWGGIGGSGKHAADLQAEVSEKE